LSCFSSEKIDHVYISSNSLIIVKTSPLVWKTRLLSL
jgi:hypothetical protein